MKYCGFAAEVNELPFQSSMTFKSQHRNNPQKKTPYKLEKEYKYILWEEKEVQLTSIYIVSVTFLHAKE